MMKLDARFQAVLRIALLILGAAVLAWSCLVLHRNVWSPDFVIWATNANAMAESGIWTGPQAVKAQAAHLFLTYYGRTVVSAALAGFWLACMFPMWSWAISRGPSAAR